MESLDGNPSEMEAMQIRLRGNLRIQLEKTRQGLQKLEQSPQRLGEAAAALSTVISQCQRSETLIDGYDLIRTTSQVQGRFELVNRVYEELRDMDTRVERCVQLLEADMLVESKGGNVATSNYNYSASNPVQNAPGGTNLLLIYMHLSQMEAFRTRTLDMMRDAPSTTIYTLKRYFRKLDELSASFDRYFWERPMALLETARRAAEGVPGAASSILATAAVIYRLEMKRDVDSNSNFLYRDSSRFKNLIDRVIASKFENAIRKALGNDAQPGDDPSAALEAIEFWLEDLSLVRTQIVPQFLPSLNVMDIYTLTMHRHVHALVTLCLQGPSDLNKNGGETKQMNPPDILYVLGWVGSYHEAMASHLGISTETLEPTLIPPERERYLISKYVQLSAQKVTEWAGNVLQRLRTSFAERKSIPDTDAEDRYVTPAGIDLFQIMKQHVETATQANNSKLLFGVVETVTTVVKKFQDGVELMISEEREIVEQSREKLDWYEEHVIMIGNTALKWVSYSSDLADFVQDSFSPEHAGPGSRYLRSLADGWVSVAKSVIAVLLSLISSSIRPAILQLFTPIWYAGTEPLMGTIVATLEDYFGDYSHHADPFLITKLASDLSDHLIILYIDQMRAKGSRLRMPAAAGLFVSDQDALASWMLSVRDPERTRRTIEPLQRWCALISAPHRMLVIDFFAFFKASSCDPSVIPLLEDVLPKRDDLDKHAVKEIVEACKKRAKEEISHSINQSKSAPSLFTRLLRTK